MAEVGSAFISLLPSMKGFGRKTEQGLQGELGSSGKRLGSKLGTAMKVGAVGGVAALGALLKGSVDEAREAQKVGALTEQIIKSTGGAAKVSAKQVGDLSTAISNKTGIDDEQVQAGANLLLTFKQVRNELGKGNQVFDRATQAAVDLSAAGFGSVESTSKQLGKALNDPVKGMTALTRSGVTFTAAQTEQVKALVASGDALGAQKIILREVESQVGGAAAAASTAGEKAAVAFGNLKEQVGTAMLPIIDKVATTFTTKVVPAISGFIAGMQSGEGVGGAFVAVLSGVANALKATFGFINQHRVALGALAVAIGAVVAITKIHTAVLAVQAAGGLAAMIRGLPIVTALTKAWAAMQWLLNAALTANPIGLVIAAVVGLVAAFVIAYKKSETFRNLVNGALQSIKAVAVATWNFIKTATAAAWEAIKNSILVPIRVLLAVLRGDFGQAKAIIAEAWEYARTKTVAAWDAIKGAVSSGISAAVGLVKQLPGKILSALGDLGSMLYNAGSELIQGLINGIMSKLGAVGDAIGSVGSKIKGFLPGSPVKEGPLKSWNNGGAGKRLVGLLADGLTDTRPVDDAMHRLTSGVTFPTAPRFEMAGAGGAGGGRRTVRLVVRDREFEAYMDERADGRINANDRHPNGRRR